jgi:hypothetical protein
MNLVSLLMLPAIITSQDDDAKRLIIAGIATAILAGSVYRSSRQSNTISVN